MNVAGGRITSGIEKNILQTKTIEFVFKMLPLWRNSFVGKYPESEARLNSHLSKFLEAQARDKFQMVLFHHEEPQSGHATVDLSITKIEARNYSINEPFLVIECKRLPAPPPKKREREYVTGENKSGGIQRFKLGVHGSTMSLVVMIGYIQSGTWNKWYKHINGWIDELARGIINDGCKWENNEQMDWIDFKDYSHYKSIFDRAYSLKSTHTRIQKGKTDTITIYHLWIDLSMK